MKTTSATQLKLPLKKRGRPISKAQNEKFRTGSGLVAHIPRQVIAKATPVHINIKFQSHLPSLRSKKIYQIFRAAVKKAREKKLSIIHFALLSNHIHLIVEAGSNKELTIMMRSFLISLAKRINVVADAHGGVFTDRYHLELIQYPKRMQHLLRYVFCNYTRNLCCRHYHGKNKVWADPYTSIFALSGRERTLLFAGQVSSTISPEIIQQCQQVLSELLTSPRTWLAQVGWKRSLFNRAS